MPTSTGNQGPDKDGDSSTPAPFATPPSTRALALVGIAVLIALLLVVIVNEDKKDGEKTAASTTQTTTTTAASNTETTSKSSSSSSTSTTKPVANTSQPSDVSVLVLNGSGTAGVATKVSEALGELDYKTLTPGDDSSIDKGTIVYYKSGFENDAKQLAINVVPGILNDLDMTQTVKSQQFPSSAPVAWNQTNLVSANVVVVVGSSS